MRFLLIILCGLSGFSYALSSTPTSMPPLQMSMHFESEDFNKKDTLNLIVELTVPEGWHVHSHHPLDSFYIASEIEAIGLGLKFGSPIFPSGEIKTLPSLGSKLSLYEGHFSIRIPAVKAQTNFHLDSTQVIFSYQACSDAICLPPKDITLHYGEKLGGEEKSASGNTQATEIQIPGSSRSSSNSFSTGPTKASEKEPSATNKETGFDFNRSFVVLFFALLFSGLALNLTPCVYPLLAITVSLFGSKAKSTFAQRFWMSFAYVMGIVITFSILGVFAAETGSLFGSFLQSTAAQAIIVGVFLLLALSAFGLFEIRMPAALMGKAMEASNSGGYVGSLLAGLFSGLLAAPCIGPVVLALLVYVAKEGSLWTGFWTFAVLSFGMGIPYLILGTSTTLLTRLPKSGDWLSDVKKIMGVILLLLADYYGRGFWGEHIYSLIFGALLLFIALYLNPFSAFEKGNKTLSAIMKVLAFIALLYSVHYLTEGLFGQSVFAAHTTSSSAEVPSLQWTAYSDAELNQGKGKVTLVDFQSKVWCAACREMEDVTFADAEVRKSLQAYHLLFVDVDKHPEAKALQEKYGILGIPTLVVIDGEGNIVDKIVGFVEPKAFLARLQSLSASTI